MVRQLLRKMRERVWHRNAETFSVIDRIWDITEEWEFAYTARWDHQDAECPDQEPRMRLAEQLAKDNPAEAFKGYKAMAAEGSVWSIWMLGWHFENGVAVEKDFGEAEKYYRKAMAHGSMRAHLDLGKMCHRQARCECWRDALTAAMRQGYLPANYWLARFEQSLAPSKNTAQRQRPMLLEAAEAGHPAARLDLARQGINGFFGLRGVLQGWRELEALEQETME